MELIVNDIVKKYNGVNVLDGVSATFEMGYCYLLLGQNGAGKSTLSKCIAGDVKPDSGSILFNDSSKNVQEQVALQYQFFSSYQHLKIREVMALFTTLTNNKNDLGELYEILGLPTYDHILLKNASGGQRKAVSIFLSFLLNKPIIILDEPFADLDLTKKKQLMFYLQQEIRQRNKMIIIISHEVAGLELLFDYVVILKDGKLIENSTQDELYRKYTDAKLPGIEGLYYEVTGQILGGKAG
ncbi:ATP-binding cassette domain-containing protein [Lysinibacillus sp. JNUCC 51]|uniref:ATP-binding cassette domain-containing protein n=1 Tax=Lysinibacillus sp. JNUCC-51 TaxID=2792479 RepID=UPI00193652DD|nr:ABC transporter ATP-binding protein [Lysinibacillus sp. JNUCC-51]